MTIYTIPINEFKTPIHKQWDKGWFLLTSGNFADGKFNSMTISWGGMGTMWGKPFVQVVVRPTRHTFNFMEANPDFTICAFADQYHKALQLLGSKSGRDGDKIKESGLTPCKSTHVTAPSFIEANLVIECRKMYADLFRPQGFIDKTLENNYQLGDYHKFYFGEVISIRGDRMLYTH